MKIIQPQIRPPAVQHHASRSMLCKVAIMACAALMGGSLILYSVTSRQQRQRHQQPAQPDPSAPHSAASSQHHDRLTDFHSAAVAAAAAAISPPTAWQQLSFNSTEPIPLALLWQTSRSSQLGAQAAAAQATWLRLNPSSLNLTLHNDSTAAEFIRHFYGPEVSEVYQSFPLGVMRSDFWRYAVLYAHGGIYSDIDVQCLRPISKWFPPRPAVAEDPNPTTPGKWASAGGLQHDKLTWHDCSLVIGLENDVHLCQWVITHIISKAQGGINTTFEHFVHHHTGPGVFTEAVGSALGLPGHTAADIAKAVWTYPAVYRRARALGVCIMAHSFWSHPVSPQNVKNLFGSATFIKDERYPSWIDERRDMLKKAVAMSRQQPLEQSPGKKENSNLSSTGGRSESHHLVGQQQQDQVDH